MTQEVTERNKGGRPSKDPAGGKRPTITFRCRTALQSQIQRAAADADRSVSEEIERRLEEGYSSPCNDSRPISAIIRSIASVIESVEAATGKTWQDDPVTASLAGDLSREVIKTLLPPLPKIENRLLALTGRAGEDTSEREWDTTAVTIARDEVLQQLASVRDRYAAGLVGTVVGTHAEPRGKSSTTKKPTDALVGLSPEVRERIKASASMAGLSPAQELERLAGIGLHQSETLGGMSVQQFATFLAQQIAERMQDAPNMAEIKNRSFEGEAVDFEAVVSDAVEEVAFRRSLDPETGKSV